MFRAPYSLPFQNQMKPEKENVKGVRFLLVGWRGLLSTVDLDS